MTTPTSPLLNRQEAADYLGVATQTLALWACEKTYPLKFIKVGRLAKYRLSDLDEFLSLRTVDGTPVKKKAKKKVVKKVTKKVVKKKAKKTH